MNPQETLPMTSELGPESDGNNLEPSSTIPNTSSTHDESRPDPAKLPLTSLEAEPQPPPDGNAAVLSESWSYSLVSDAVLKGEVDEKPGYVQNQTQDKSILEDRISVLESLVCQLMSEQSRKSPPSLQEDGDNAPPPLPTQHSCGSRTTIHMVPQFNAMRWQPFRDSMRESYQNYCLPDSTCAIDILVEEDPFPSSPYPEHGDSMCTERNSQGSLMSLQAGTFQDWPSDYDGPPPDRLRLNSPCLMSLFFHLINPENADYDTNIVLFRPYLSLLSHEKEIRQWLKILECRWSPEGNIAQPQSQQTAQTDTEAATPVQEPYEDDQRELPVYCKSIRALNETRLVVDFIESCLKPHVARITHLDNQKIQFVDLCFLFKLGEVVISRDKSQAYRVIQVIRPHHPMDATSQFEPYKIRCVHMDYDGNTFGPVITIFKIQRYRGMGDIKSLIIYPLRFEENSADIYKTLLAQGKESMRVANGRHMYCKGTNSSNQEQIDGQVMIDFEQALAENPRWAPHILEPGTNLWVITESVDGDGQCGRPECCGADAILYDLAVEQAASWKLLQQNGIPAPYLRSRRIVGEESTPEDDELMLLTGRVFGFILKTRKWGIFDINDISEVQRSSGSEGLEQLVLPDGHKKMLESLVRHHLRRRKGNFEGFEQVDIVRGKGSGLTILLHGVPGVGKTSTAESIADCFEKPLLPITCGDLGVTLTDVEQRLETSFTLAHRWDCILLLDNANVLLAERTREDLTRNSIASVFLRVLDRHTGVLFLTTNRVGAFDEAFRSRIHLSLYYPPLSEALSIKVWKVAMSQTRKRERSIRIKEEEILEFAVEHYNVAEHCRWNGRQIRNAFQIAIALAENDAYNEGKDEEQPKFETEGSNKKPLTVTLRRRHFEKVAKANNASFGQRISKASIAKKEKEPSRGKKKARREEVLSERESEDRDDTSASDQETDTEQESGSGRE